MNRTVLYFFLSTLTSLFLFGCSADDNNQPVAPDLNRAPYSPVLIAPANDSANVPVDAWFYWRCEDEDGDHLTYDVYAGSTMTNPLSPVEHNFLTKAYIRIQP